MVSGSIVSAVILFHHQMHNFIKISCVIELGSVNNWWLRKFMECELFMECDILELNRACAISLVNFSERVFLPFCYKLLLSVCIIRCLMSSSILNFTTGLIFWVLHVWNQTVHVELVLSTFISKLFNVILSTINAFGVHQRNSAKFSYFSFIWIVMNGGFYMK